MQYNQPYGVTDPNAGYINGDPSVGQAGSIPPAASIEYPQREIVALINAGNLVPNNGDLVQLAKAIQSGAICFAVDTSGAANTVVATLNPNPGSYKAGNVYFVKMKFAPTGPSTVNFNGIGFAPIVKSGGAPLAGGEWAANDVIELRCDGTKFFTGTQAGAAAGLPPNVVIKPTANLDIYVNASTGSDTLYDGTTATVSGAHGPFKTIQMGVNTAFNYAPSQYQITIHVAAGTYTEAVSTPLYAGPSLIIDGGNAATTMVNSTSVNAGAGYHVIAVQGPNVMTCQNISVTNTTSGGNWCGFVGESNATMKCFNTGSDVMSGWIFYGNDGAVASNGHNYHGASIGGIALSIFGNVNVTGNHTFNNAINVAGQTMQAAGGTCGVSPQNPATWINFSNVTGIKYSAYGNGVVTAQGLGVNYFPGTVPGSVSSGGQYLG
jgi:hypothetical protein